MPGTIAGKPTQDELRRFVRTTALSSLIISAFLWWKGSASHGWEIDLGWTGHLPQVLAVIVLVLGVSIGVMGLVSSAATRTAFLISAAVGAVVGSVVGRVLLLVVFFGIVTPIGFCMRLVGKDTLDRDWNSDRETYWTDAEQDKEPSSYRRQF
jgi:polyferredoxin